LRAPEKLGGFGVPNSKEADPSSSWVCEIVEVSNERSKELGWPEKAEKREPPQASCQHIEVTSQAADLHPEIDSL